ncbi:hypothetical protein J2128_001100 [Methanomicrobium sp. W14]|uniref:hypothetical protein n=1 Tax=Methanomicrobium sp. W14 TaxID=2817839 RepID=UPI001AE9959A|nr:hypothetical protein [Methanomicrobium sp. W14]MBP2133179.1 hypothetical protein [Methanomicrobium sp. W14]
MNPKELMNFSIYDFDLDKFGGSFEEVRELIGILGLDGIELLVNFDEVPQRVPKDLVKAVHLPSFMGWVRVWNDENFVIPKEIGEESVEYFYGGRNRDEIVSNLCKCLCNSSCLNPAYGVFHASFTEVESAFAEKQPFSDREVLSATAELLNETASNFPGGEPPFDIYIENLWYPGLTFLNSDLALEFMDMLKFKRWKFILDTGHMMNSTKECYSENQAVEVILRRLEELDPEVVKRIDAMHLQLSTSGKFQESFRGPDNYSELDYDDKFVHIMNYLGKVDEHRPFSTEGCRRIAEFISPSFITHELQAKTAFDIKNALSRQICAFRRDS